jgi:RNA polymerase sigma factor (sigma-70 family)
MARRGVGTGHPPAGGHRARLTHPVAKKWPPAVTRRARGRDLKGVDQADGEIYRKHADELTRFATGLVGPSHAPDVVSEAVLRAMNSEAWPRVVERRAYLFRCVYHEALRLHRTIGRRRSREERAALAESVDQPDIRPEVLAAVNRLSLRQRAVIVLTYWDDLDPAAVADLLDISDGAVRRHLARGRSRLKEVLDADS